MIKYNFTSDLRISSLRESIKKAAIAIFNDQTSKLDKSGQNNAATLSFYFNLKKGTNTLDLVLNDDVTQVIRNFILKFQFPNPYTKELLCNHLENEIKIAPLRSICKLLIFWAYLNPNVEHYLSYDEIKYFFFCNPSFWVNSDINSISDTIEQIESSRLSNVDFSAKIKSTLDWNQYDRQSRELITTICHASNCFKISKGRLIFSFPNIKDDNFASEMQFLSNITNYNNYWDCDKEDIDKAEFSYQEYMDIPGTISIDKQVFNHIHISSMPLQQIYFGAPGTGKSFTIDGIVNKDNSVRTTFHPDSDYSTFVGCYKPIKNKETDEITYEFVPQAFTTAYVNAWKNLDEPYYLVIEEINRGNCAQIFGDIFQLLDRDSKTGYSSYKITPDKDLQDYLATALKGCDIDDDIKSGEKMQLPSNLNILATMNTSDQSLFPIDSAFKRRWDWKYIPIDYTDNGHYIACGSNKYKWTEFLDAVNKRIESVTQSEDKKMGGWFVKPNGKEISADKFVSKVVFYLWNDVFKDFGHDGNSIFKEDFNKFHKFFDNKGDVKLDVLEKFLVSLEIKPIIEETQNTDTTEEVQD